MPQLQANPNHPSPYGSKLPDDSYPRPTELSIARGHHSPFPSKTVLVFNTRKLIFTCCMMRAYCLRLNSGTSYIASDEILRARLEARLGEKPAMTDAECIIC
jgi:hypothetical protein